MRIGNLMNIDTGAFLAARGRDEWAGLTLTEPLTGRCWTAGRDGVREVTPVVV